MALHTGEVEKVLGDHTDPEAQEILDREWKQGAAMSVEQVLAAFQQWTQ